MISGRQCQQSKTAKLATARDTMAASLNFGVQNRGRRKNRIHQPTSSAVTIPFAISRRKTALESFKGMSTASPQAVSALFKFSSILPKIIFPLAVWSTLVTEISTILPISFRA